MNLGTALSSLWEKAVGKGKWNDKDESRFAKLVNHYSKNHKDGKFRLDVEFKLGLIYYDKSKYGKAAPVFYSLGRQVYKN